MFDKLQQIILIPTNIITHAFDGDIFVNGNAMDETDFINESEKDATPANDVNRVSKMEDDAIIHPVFMRDNLATDGSDGNLTITSGATDIDCGGAQILIKNYNDISITGTGSLTFSNPHANGTTIILLCRKFTVTSSTSPAIDASAMGGKGGSTVNTSTDNTTVPHATDNEDGIGLSFYKTNTTTNYTGGALPSLATWADLILSPFSKLFQLIIPSAGGLGGSVKTFNNSSASITSGAGGRGGGCLVVNCAGEWNVTSGISVAGEDGTNATGTANVAMAGGGGGGAGGFFLGLYRRLIANSGSVDISGGIGGLCLASATTGATQHGGGGGASIKNGGGTATSCGGDNYNEGGDGGEGMSLVTRNAGTIAL